jgi:transcriptional regulator with XRE-family HTH domain
MRSCKQFLTDPITNTAMMRNMTDAVTTDPSIRRREAGIFLRSRRERLRPGDVGLPQGFRRRTPGLRREEVAILAGVGTTWYTWLEQGRDVRPSPEVLAALADALRLDTAERRHLFLLNNQPAPQIRPAAPERVDASLCRMLDSLTGQPALVLGRRWDILAWNRAADAVFGPYDRLRGDECNMLNLVFADQEHRRLLADWEAVAKSAIAMFRGDCVRYAGDASFERLVVRLTERSPEFAAWWPRREVAEPLAGRKRLDHPTAGRMEFEYSSFSVSNQADMKLIVFTPLEEDGSARKLERLLAEVPPGSPTQRRHQDQVPSTEA